MWQFVQSCEIISLFVHLHMSDIYPKQQVADTMWQFVQSCEIISLFVYLHMPGIYISEVASG